MLFQYLFIHYFFMTVSLKRIIILMNIIMSIKSIIILKSISIIYLLTWHTLESPSAMLHIIAGVN